jgi:PAS domain S-box-containing protein
MVQDLSDEESKSEQLKLLGHSINCISEMVSITDNEDKFIFINKAFKDRYGYTEEEIIGQTPKIINTDHVKNQYVLKNAKEKRWTGELINKTKIGEIFPIALETSVVENDSGLAIGFIGVAKDLSQQKKVEESLKKLSKAVEQNPAAIMITDRDGYIEYVNPKFYEITGYSIDEVIGKNPRFLKSGNKSEREYQELWDIILSGNEWRGEFVNKKKNGEIFQEYAIISPIKDSSGTITHFVGVKEDITAKKEAEENLQRSENLATLGRMTSYLSHEIKTPLTAIKLNVEMLMEQLESNNAYEKPFQIIDKEIKRLEKLLKDVLQFSKNKDNILSEISLNELLEQVIDLLNPVLREKKIEIQNNISSERINGDTGELKTLFHQLIENSMDAIEHKGLIEFRSVIDKKTNMHRIFVRDNGCGIKVPKKIFEPFFSTKQSGTGLGLSIVQQIIEKHKGTISLVFSEPGNTIFQVSLPLFK